VADEYQGEDELAQPGPGDGQVEEDLGVVRSGIEGITEGLLGAGSLLVDKLAADLGLAGQFGDGAGAGQGVQGELLPLRGVRSWAGQGVPGCGGRAAAGGVG
jgi:hypothetical protein